MSLNKLYNKEQGIELGFQIGCETLACNSMECKTIVMEVGGDIDAHDIAVSNLLTVNGATNINGNNYATPNLGVANYSLHTDGLGSTFWSPDDTGTDGGIVYAGIPPTISGQLALFNDSAGGGARQSLIIDDGTSLNLNNENLTNVKDASIETLKIVDVLDVSKFEIKYNGSETHFENGSASVQMKIIEDTNVEVVYDLDVVGNTNCDTIDTLTGALNIGSNVSNTAVTIGRPAITTTIDSTFISTGYSVINDFNSKSINILQQDAKVDNIEWELESDVVDNDLLIKNNNSDEVIRIEQTDKVVRINTDGETIPPNWALGSSLIIGGGGSGFSTLGIISEATTGYAVIRMGESANSVRGSILYFNGDDTMSFSTAGTGRLQLGPIVKSYAPFETDDFDSYNPVLPLDIGAVKATKINICRSGIETEIKGELKVDEVASFADGTELLPSITFSNDTNTGFYCPSTDNLDIVTGGISRLRVEEEKIIIQDDCNIQLGSTSDIPTKKGVTTILKSDGIIFNGAVLKIVNVGGTARVSPLQPGDPDSTSVIGISGSSTNADNQDIIVTIGGVFEAIVAVGSFINIGNPIEKSDVNIGRVQASAVSAGTFGIALTAGTGDVAGNVTILGMFVKNEGL